MRVRITFLRKTEGNAIVYHHQHLIGELIRQIINSRTEIFRKALVDVKIKLSEFNLYCYSSLKGSLHAEGGLLHYIHNRVTLVVSSPVNEFVQTLLEEFLKIDEIKLQELSLKAEMFDVTPLPIFREEMRYICVSPIAIGDPKVNAERATQFMSPTDPAFTTLLKNAALRKMEKLLGRNFNVKEYSRFQLIPDTEYIQRLAAIGKKFARLLQHGNQQVRGYVFPFTLVANPKVHELIWETGMGEMGSEGFGLLDFA